MSFMFTLLVLHISCMPPQILTHTDFVILHLCWVDPNQHIQVLEFQEFSTHAGQDATVKCEYTEDAKECLNITCIHVCTVNIVTKHMLVCFHETHFNRVRELEAKRKVIYYIYASLGKQSSNDGITVGLLSPKLKGNWTQSNYDHTEQQLYARRDN